jgi:hypothetical protein
MQRDELWKALSDASDAVESTMAEWTQAPTPENRFRMDEAMRDFIKSLPPVVGSEAAFEFETAFQKFVDSTDRGVHFLATLAGRTVDRSDREMLKALKRESETALEAFCAVDAAMRTKAQAIVQRDEFAKLGRKWTRALIDRLADHVGPAERWRSWLECGEHAWKDLPTTIDTGEHFCTQCCTRFSADGTPLNAPVDPATPVGRPHK